jgi:hypothetical protein
MRKYFQSVRYKNYAILLMYKSQQMSSLLIKRMCHMHLHQPSLGMHQDLAISLLPSQYHVLLPLDHNPLYASTSTSSKAERCSDSSQSQNAAWIYIGYSTQTCMAMQNSPKAVSTCHSQSFSKKTALTITDAAAAVS